MERRWGVLMACAALCVMLSTTPANAAFPGTNGRIVVQGRCNLQTIKPDGTDIRQITFYDTCGSWTPNGPAWSPDGTKIAYSYIGEIYAVDADGAGVTKITTSDFSGAGDWAPSWSPDGTQIAFTRSITDELGNHDHVWIVEADGSNAAPLETDMCESFQPQWNPNGMRILFSGSTEFYGGGCAPGSYDAWLIDPDGTDRELFPADGFHDWSPDGTRVVFVLNGELHTQPADGSSPPTPVGAPGAEFAHWSPDGTKIVFRRIGPPGASRYLWTINVDGTGETQITTIQSLEADWQPIPVNAYPRPKGASPTRVSLVPAYAACSAPDRTHGPPLAFASCSSPNQTSSQLTLGSPDANQRPAKSVSYLGVNPLRGDPGTPADEADVRLRALINDVRLASDLSDYSGDLEARLGIQITDRDNTPHPGGPGPATVQSFTHSAPLPCSATADTTVGSTCEFDTTVEALVPGAVKEQLRAIWELGAIRVHDGAGNLFLTQGIFVP